MALYQPTNIIPSSYTKGTVDVNDTMEIAWQINGNSAMTAFQIDFYLNDYASTPVTSTGKQPVDNFYGTDRFGRPQLFTWSPNGQTWEEWSKYQLTNGNEYKYKITQWYKDNNSVIKCEITPALTSGTLYYFEVPSGDYQGAIISFTAVDGLTSNPAVYFSLDNGSCWAENLNRTIFLAGSISLQGKIPAGGTQILMPGDPIPPDGNYFTGIPSYVTLDYIVTLPTSFILIKTQATPKLTIFRSSTGEYSDEIDFPNGGSIATSIGFFKAEYEQLQGDPIRWIRWQVATAIKNTDGTYKLGEILADTGDIYTPTLNYEYNGFFNEQSYAIRCLGESENGQATELQGADDNGWIYFTINIVNQSEYRGEFTLQCLNKENAALLEWSSEEIPPTTQGEYVLNNGSVELKEQGKISWEKQNAFLTPWIAAFNLSLQTAQSFVMTGRGAEIVRTFTTTGLINGVSVSNQNNVRTYATSISDDKKSCTVTLVAATTIRQTYATIILNTTPTNPIGQLAEIQTESNSLTFSGELNSDTRQYRILLNSTQIEIPQNTTNLVLLITPTSLIGYSNGVRFINQTFQYTQLALNSIQISGGTNGATFNCVTIYKGNLDIEVLDELYSSTTFKPTWTSSNYSLYMTANFIENIDGGTVAAFRVYRQEIGKNTLQSVLYTKGNVLKVKDFGIVSRKAYTYWLYEYDSQDAFLKGVQCKLKNNYDNNTIATCFKNYSLLVCDYDETYDEYHVRKQYLFALNLSTGSVGNNNSPTLNKNFTPYPTRMPDTANYKNGTLVGLIGAIYTVPALIEQIGNYKWTTKPSTMDYFDNVDLEKELYDLSTAPYRLFLRDMKGRLRMIHTSAPITMTTNIKQKQQSISMSLPWVEIGDASDVTIIQTSDDYGWNNDNQVLDVQLDVDVAMGELSATYPFPYSGTKFYLTGVNKETLTAKTPLGITPAQFELSETATQPEDGEVSATVKVNNENDN